jgi:hypothetical protein
VVPPLALDAGHVAAEIVVFGQLAKRGLLARTGTDLASERKVRHLANAAVGTPEYKRHFGAIVDNGGP